MARKPARLPRAACRLALALPMLLPCAPLQARETAARAAPAASAASAAGSQPLTVEAAMTAADVVTAALSPDGRHVAAIIQNESRRSVLLVDADTLSHRIIIQGRWAVDGFYNISKHPISLSWVTADRIAVNYGYVSEAHDLNGKRTAELGHGVLGKARPDDPQSPLVLVYNDDKHQNVAVVDVYTGKSRRLRYPMYGQAQHFAFDERGELRAMTLSDSSFWNDKALLSQWYRRSDGEWIKLLEQPITAEAWVPLAAVADKDELVVSARHERDTLGLFTYLPLQRRFGELLAGHPTEDLVDTDDPRARAYRSVLTLGMKPVRVWFDTAWAELQKSVDHALPERINTLDGKPGARVLVHSYSDRDPGRWYLLDGATMRMRELLAAHPLIEPEQMRPMEVIRYAAPDGLSIPAYLTRPAGPGLHPLVVVVHGGPAVRDHWAWDPEVQLLAARGYMVLQPQFRGSRGFGRAFEKAGHRQWGRAMQDDITAGVQHLVKTGAADGARVCIYGASYGGYAAVWGLVKTPDLYRCGITLAGVSDIGHVFTDWSDIDKVSREIARLQIGDPKADKAYLDEVSPLLHAQAIRAPLLIAHGEDDVRVPMAHSERLMRALDRHRRPYQWLRLRDEGHSVQRFGSRVRFNKALLEFIDKHIGATRAADNPER